MRLCLCVIRGGDPKAGEKLVKVAVPPYGPSRKDRAVLGTGNLAPSKTELHLYP